MAEDATHNERNHHLQLVAKKSGNISYMQFVPWPLRVPCPLLTFEMPWQNSDAESSF